MAILIYSNVKNAIHDVNNVLMHYLQHAHNVTMVNFYKMVFVLTVQLIAKLVVVLILVYHAFLICFYIKTNAFHNALKCKIF
jgi:hypothetical protein